MKLSAISSGVISRGGRTWPSHHVISDKVGFNYTSIREIAPGRLLYIHDAPKMNWLTVDVEKPGP